MIESYDRPKNQRKVVELMQDKLARSFGRRKARKLRETSQKAYEDILPLVRIDLSSLDLALSVFNPNGTIPAQEFGCQDIAQQIFKNTPSETWLEIGFGGGEHILEQLAQNPSVAMVGCEPFMNGVAKLLTHLLPEDYDRVRIWHEDVRYLLDHIPPSFFTRAFILFPDPWPKKRHQVRRLITQEFIERLLPTLKEGAFLHVASDDASYVEQIQAVLYHHPELVLCKGPLSADPLTWDARPEGWPITRYEQKAMTQSKNCAYMEFQKKEKV
jgi:tRNA (guanine-N7-)-methyltransferase